MDACRLFLWGLIVCLIPLSFAEDLGNDVEAKGAKGNEIAVPESIKSFVSFI